MTNTLNGATTAAFVVALSQPLTEPVQVKWATKDGTGKAGTDYDAVSGSLTFAPGETSKQIQVTVYGRDPGQGAGDKSFYIVVEPPINAILDDTLVECTIVVMDEEGTPVTSVIVAQGRRGPKGEPGLSAYEQAVLMGYQGSIQDWMDDVADASQAAVRANTAADRSETAAVRAESAATSASFLGNIFPTPAAGVDPVTGVANGAYFNVRSPSSDNYLDEYQNVNGSPVASGKSFPSAEIINQIRKIGGTMKFEQRFADAIGGFDINDHVMLDTGGIVKSTVLNNTVNPNNNISGWKPDTNVLHPSFFGVNEGTADATELLRLMHTVANNFDIDVSYAGVKSLNVQANARININTNTDFAGCRFDLLNGIVSNPTWNGSTYRLFIVKDPNRTITTFNLNPSELFQGAKQITVPDTAIEGYLFLESDKRIGNRTSAPTTNLYFKQSFTLSGGGILNYPLIKDLTANTATATLYNDPSKKWITIKGLYADISKFNNQCLLDVQRNYTRVAEFAFERNVKDTSANAESLIWFTYCSIVIFENSRSVAPQIRDGVTTSGLSIGYCSDVVLRNLYGLDKESWGFTTTNFVTGLVTENCHIGRMDNHQGCMFWRIIGGSLHNKAIQYSWGGGFLDVDGLTVTNKEILLARNDYDNDFDGHISLRNIKWILNDPASMDTDAVDNGSGAVTRYIGHIFSCYQAGTTSTNGGSIIPVKLADSIHIENLEIIAPNIPEGQLTINAINFDLIDASAIVRMPHTIKIRNVHSDKNRFYFTTAKGRYYKAYPYYSSKDGIYRDTVWKFKDIDSLYCNGRRHGFIGKSGANEQVSAFTQFAAQSKTFQFKFDDCTGVVLDYTMPNAVYRMNNCDIGALNFGAVNPSNANCTVNSSRMINTVRTEAGNGRLGQIGTGASECKLYNVEIVSDVNPVFMSAVIGTVFNKSVAVNWSSTTIPQLTYAQMFNGWYNASKYL